MCANVHEQIEAVSSANTDLESGGSSAKVSIETAEDIKAALEKAVARFGGLKDAVQFVFGDTGSFHVLGTEVTVGTNKADCTISMSVEDFASIVNADFDVMGAVMEGKVKIDGDSAIAISIQGLF